MSAEPEALNPLLELIGKMLDRLDKMSQAPPPARQADQTENIANLAESLAAAQGEFTNPSRSSSATVKGKSKDGTPFEYDYKYSDLADIFTVVRAPMSKFGLAILQTSRYDRASQEAVVRTTLLHKSGEWIRSELRFPWEGTKIQDLGSCFTYLRRYSLSAMIGIAPEEDDDGKAADQGKGKGDKASAGDKSSAGDMPNEEQLAQFWADWKELWPTRFATKDEALAWLKEIDVNPTKANLGGLRSIISRLKLKKRLDGQADKATTTAAAGDKKPAKGKEQKTPEQKRREALQGRWRGLVVDKFKKFDAGKALEAACWWAGEYFSWVREPYTEMINGQLVVTRPKATLTAVEDVARAVDALAKLNEDQVDQIFDEWSHWIDEQLRELNPPAEDPEEAQA